MIDSTNPRIMANAIKKLFSLTKGLVVVKGNPSGSGFNTLLTKLQIGSTKYKLPNQVIANPEDEASDALSKIKIGSDVFSVGGGSDPDTWEELTTVTFANDVTTHKAYTNGKRIVIYAKCNNGHMGGSIAEIPTGYRPYLTAYGVGTGNSNALCMYTVGTNGALTTSGTITTSAEIYLTYDIFTISQ